MRIAVQSLVRSLTSDSFLNQAGAARALGELRDPSAVVPLCQVLETGGQEVFIEACTALGKIGKPSTVHKLCHASGRVRDFRNRDKAEEAVYTAILRMGPPAIPELCAALDELGEGTCATEALSRFGSKALPELTRTLRTGGWYARCNGLRALAKIGEKDPSALPLAHHALTSDNPSVQIQALEILIEYGDGSAIPDLQLVLQDASPRIDRLASAVMLRVDPDLKWISAAIEALEDEDDRMVAAVARVLAQYAQKYPGAAIRGAIPTLRKRSGNWFNNLDPVFRHHCQEAADAIETVTAGVQDLPLPASASVSSEDLPLPSDGPTTADKATPSTKGMTLKGTVGRGAVESLD